MNVNRKTIVQFVIFFLVAFGLIYWQYNAMTDQQVSEIKDALINTKWAYLFYAILIGFLSHLVRSLRWRMLLIESGINARINVTVISVLLGYLANTLLPRMGEIAKCSTMSRYEGAPFEKSLGTVISERLFDVLSLLLLFLIVFAFEYDTLATYGSTLISKFFYDDYGNFHTLKLLGIIIVLLVVSGLFIYLFKRIKNNKIKMIIQNAGIGMKSILKLKKKGLFLLYTLSMWILYIAMVYVAFKAVDSTEQLGWIPAMAVTAFGSIAIIFTPGGIGAYPPVVAAILSFYRIDTADGLAAGWVSWTMQTAVVIILGLLALLVLTFITPHKNLKNEPTSISPTT